jgi:hypothetical protein
MAEKPDSSDAHDDVNDDDNDANVINASAAQLETLKTEVVRLHRMHTEMSASAAFDASDLAIVRQRYAQRLHEFFEKYGQIAGLLKLFRQDLAALEALVQQKINTIGDIDARLGTISRDEQLCAHFAARVVTCLKLLRLVKRELRSAIESKLHA